jgi:hypothetical protein
MTHAYIAVIGAAVLLAGCESNEHRIDREVAWKDVKPYDVTKHGVDIGWITVPGHTQEVRFFLWGIPREEEEYMKDDQLQICATMDRDAESHEIMSKHETDNLGDLTRLSIAAYNHGFGIVILTERIAYAASWESGY